MTNMQKPQNEECWTLSPNPTNTHSEGVGDIDDSTGMSREFLKKMKFPHKKKSPGRDGQIEKGREDVGSHQAADTPVAFVRKSSRESGVISMSIFLARNNAQSSQICEGDKYPTIGAVLTALSICISSMRPTTSCSVVKDTSTVTVTNSSLTPTTSRVSGGISMLCRAQQVSFSPSSC
jgi:hypothetical protein